MPLPWCATRLAVTLTAAFFGVSCGGSVGSGASTSVTGTINGISVATTDTVAILEPNGSLVTAGVAITNIADTCGVLQRLSSGGPQPARSAVLAFSVTVNAGPVPAGTYTIGGQSSSQASANFGTTDSNCQTVIQQDAVSGSLTYTTVSSTMIAGSFDVTFATGHVTGKFMAPVCNASGNTSGTPACGH